MNNVWIFIANSHNVAKYVQENTKKIYNITDQYQTDECVLLEKISFIELFQVLHF